MASKNTRSPRPAFSVEKYGALTVTAFLSLVGVNLRALWIHVGPVIPIPDHTSSTNSKGCPRRPNRSTVVFPALLSAQLYEAWLMSLQVFTLSSSEVSYTTV